MTLRKRPVPVNYLLAIFIPPLSILLAGKIITSIFAGILWLFSIFIFPIIGHLIFVVLAWVMIAQAANDRRHREMMDAQRKK